MLNDSEKQMIESDTAELIRASGEMAEILGPQVTGTGEFAGPHEPQEQSLGSVPIEFKQLSPEDLKQIGADGICSMLPDADVAEGDFLIFNQVRYRISDIKSANCFGTITHITVKLEREYQKQS